MWVMMEKAKVKVVKTVRSKRLTVIRKMKKIKRAFSTSSLKRVAAQPNKAVSCTRI